MKQIIRELHISHMDPKDSLSAGLAVQYDSTIEWSLLKHPLYRYALTDDIVLKLFGVDQGKI